MRKLEEIYNDVEASAIKNNCQSYKSIAIAAMEKALEDFASDIEDNLDELLNNFTR